MRNKILEKGGKNVIKEQLFRSFVELSNSQIQSAILKSFTRSSLSKWVIPSFVRYYRIQIDEMEKPLKDYQNLHDLFTRKLKKEARKIDYQTHAIVSPVDGTFVQRGEISKDQRFFVKNQWYTLAEMLGSFEKSKTYQCGTYMIFYLSPSNYHRIHSPVEGSVLGHWILGGKSTPVNEWGITYGKRPFSTNYRHITEIENQNKKIAIVKVGALNVNSIELTNKKDVYEKGEEIAYFSFGSTVILLFEEGYVNSIVSGEPKLVQMGEKIGEQITK